jgi:hypothetical protein
MHDESAKKKRKVKDVKKRNDAANSEKVLAGMLQNAVVHVSGASIESGEASRGLGL